MCIISTRVTSHFTALSKIINHKSSSSDVDIYTRRRDRRRHAPHTPTWLFLNYCEFVILQPYLMKVCIPIPDILNFDVCQYETHSTDTFIDIRKVHVFLDLPSYSTINK